MDSQPKTPWPPPLSVLTDLDGTLIEHNREAFMCRGDATVLPGVLEKLTEWNEKGYKVIITTGRPKSRRLRTMRQLRRTGIKYDQLVMGLNRGLRILINDQKPDMPVTAKAYNLERNAGIGGVDE